MTIDKMLMRIHITWSALVILLLITCAIMDRAITKTKDERDEVRSKLETATATLEGLFDGRFVAAKSGSNVDIQNAMDRATNGQWIVYPGGIYSWTNQIAFSFRGGSPTIHTNYPDSR